MTASSARFLLFKQDEIEPARPFLISLTGKLGSLWWETRSGILPGKLLRVSNKLRFPFRSLALPVASASASQGKIAEVFIFLLFRCRGNVPYVSELECEDERWDSGMGRGVPED